MLADPLEVIEGQPAELVVKAQGKPAPRIVWYRNDKLVKQDDKVQLETTEEGLESTGKITFPAIELAREGRYTFEAVNEAGKVKAEVPITGMEYKNMLLLFSLSLSQQRLIYQYILLLRTILDCASRMDIVV
jgi:hypothetical protein